MPARKLPVEEYLYSSGGEIMTYEFASLVQRVKSSRQVFFLRRLGSA